MVLELARPSEPLELVRPSVCHGVFLPEGDFVEAV